MNFVQKGRQNQLIFFFFALCCCLASSLSAAESKTSIDNSREQGINIVSADDSGIQFHLHTEKLSIDSEGNVQADGLQQRILQPGAPSLPYYSTYIAIPPEATVSVSFSESDIVEHEAIDVLSVPHQQLNTKVDPTGMLVADPQFITESVPTLEKDDSIYGSDKLFPGFTYQISEPQYMRDLRLVELKLFPVRYNPKQRTLTQTSDLFIRISFLGSNTNNLRPSPGYVDKQAQSLSDMVLNFDQARAWRSLPNAAETGEAVADLPIGVDTFKIQVDQNGIYEISAHELKNAGMVLPADPQTIEMMYRGLPVAYQFIDGNINGQFDEGDRIRFYGWAFDGSRYEKMYVGDNVFWLWAGGTAYNVSVQANQTGSGNVTTSFVDTITRQDENDNFSGWGIIWENEPTIWQWDLMYAPSGTAKNWNYDIDLPNPDPTSAENHVTVEVTTKSTNPAHSPNHTAKIAVNDNPQIDENTWTGRLNLNFTTSVPGTGLKQPGEAGYPTNQIKIDLSSDSAAVVTVYLTRISVVYSRLLQAVEDQLIFSAAQAGHHDFHVSGFSSGDANEVIVWDISDRLAPEEIAIQAQDIQDNGGDFTYKIGRPHGHNAEFISTTTQNIRTVKNVTRYTPGSLDPPNSKGRWLAITHSSLRSAAVNLANYRSQQYSTWVVNSEDIVNQFGYGFNTPQAIRKYLYHAIVNWTETPEYITLFGDATRNPLGQECPLCGSWDKDAKTLLVTDFAFVDRWNGMVPSDFTMSLIVGNDLLPDAAIGRMPAATLAEANNMVQKVIDYENQRGDWLETWQRNFVFLADDKDSGGDFCQENIQTSYSVPRGPYHQTHLCLTEPTADATEALRLEVSKQINDIGLSVLNFRGHGSTTAWAGSAGSPPILTNEDIDFWQNVGRPTVIISADCLDGYFIFTHTEALGETFHSLSNRGSAAHWSSSGLGFSSEHSVLHVSFYQGLFNYRYKQMGDAVNHAKVKYYQAGQFPSELYSFVLLGDPALKVIPVVESGIFFPFIKARF
ncbi:MAG: C25 family cysteine peptidase [Candidatus Promineifilaceae bacterium]|nr:C25 family cysteine peptidase [Candidatus Promineifilaceae bacterium]